MPVPIHVKSCFSLGLGTAQVEALVERAARRGQPAIALTDLESLYAQPRFFAASRARGVRAIAGIELRPTPMEKAGRLVCLARNALGWRSLSRIASRRRSHDRADEREDPWQSVAREPTGLIVLSDDARVIERLLEQGAVTRDAVGLLLVRPGSTREHEEELERAATRMSIPLVADRDVIFLDASDHELHRLQRAVALGVAIDELPLDATESAERMFPLESDDRELFADRPDAIEAARTIAEACTLDLAQLLMPAPYRPRDAEPLERLRVLAERALAESTRDDAHLATSRRRLEHELDVVARSQFAPTLCAAAEIARLARELNVPLAARGSAAGSLLVHLLGALSLDPLDHGLLFERFLHPARAERPDIDLDVASSRREELVARSLAFFGSENAAGVGALHVFRRRSAWRSGLRALGFSERDVERAIGLLPAVELATGDLDEPPPTVHDPRLAAATAAAERLIGLPRHPAAHPSALVVFGSPLADALPLERATNGSLVTQFDGESLASLGVSKIDLLGSHLLDELDIAVRLSQETPDVGPTPCSIAAIPAEDAETLATIARAHTLGCFQLESPAMRRLLLRSTLRGFDDVVTALALLRPGAAGGEAKERFTRRARGDEPPTPAHPLLARVVASTQGLLVFDEQILEAIADVSGLSLEEADVLRVAVQRSGVDPEAASVAAAMFRAGATARGVAASDADAVWSELGRFARYSFCRAHAASHARQGWQAAWLATHRPAEFACAVLDHHGGLYPIRTLAAEFVRRGVVLRPPSVNRSLAASTVEDARRPGRVRLGLARVRRLAHTTLVRCLEERESAGPFVSESDFIARVLPSRRELEQLARAGALDELQPELRTEPRPCPDPQSEQRAAPADDLTPDERSRALKVQRLRRIQDELAALDVHVSDHPLAVLRGEATAAGCLELRRVLELDGGRVRVAALLAAMRRVDTRAGTIRYLTLEDETALCEAVLDTRAERELGRIFKTPGPYLCDGFVRRDGRAVQIAIDAAIPFHDRERARPEP